MKKLKENALTQEKLKEILHYNPGTGDFIRIKSRINQVVGSVDKNSGYIRMMVDGKLYYAHRLAWLYVYGYFPKRDIAHKNRIYNDNRIKNLRVVSKQRNAKNRKISVTNTSGVAGVCWAKQESKWVATIGVSGKPKTLGYFKDLIDAVYARWEAENEYNWPNCNTTSTAFNRLIENI